MVRLDFYLSYNLITMNNNQFKFNSNNGQIPPQMMMLNGMGKRTNSAYKFMIILVIGILPLLLCALFIVDSSMATEFKQWGSAGVKNATIDVDYGFMWLIGLAVYIAIFPVCIFLTKISDEISLDIVPGTSAAGLVMLNMFVIPHSSAWFLLLSIPSFLIIGFIIGIIVIAFVTISAFNKKMIEAQNNPEFKQMVNELQKMQGQNPGQGPMPTKKPDAKVEGNPFVDVEDESENDEEK